MIRRLFSAAFLVSLILVTSGAIAQERNEIAVTFGRSFVSDQTVNGVPSFDTTLHFGNRFTLEGDYGRRLVNFGIVGLTAEVPFTITFHQDVDFPSESHPQELPGIFCHACTSRKSVSRSRNFSLGQCGRGSWSLQ